MNKQFFVVFLVLLQAASCTSSKTIQYENIPLQRAQIELAAEQVLDIGILIFDPNLPK